jgi:hypothetical protein
VTGERGQLPAVVDIAAPVTTAALCSALAVPAMIVAAGDHAAKRFLDFFAASIENDNTRQAYYRAVSSFFAWLEQHGLGELPDIEPFHVAAYLKALRVSAAGDRAAKERTAARPTVKQHLAAIRMLFDWLVDQEAGWLRDRSAVARRPARPRADRGHGLQLCQDRRGRRDAGRGLFCQRQALVAAAA